MTELPGVIVKVGADLPIYKMVDGQRVRIPSKSAGRRYSHVTDVSSGEQYYLEFTDEQEADADRQKAQWEAEAAQREAERLRLEAEYQKFTDGLVYERKIVAFVDILGWSNLIQDTHHSIERSTVRAGKALREMAFAAEWTNQINEIFSSLPRSSTMNASQFSDCIVISSPADTIGYGQLLQILGMLSDIPLKHGFFIRGGICVGDIYHKDQIVFGPALISAYEIESQKSKYPRICISNTTYSDLMQLQSEFDIKFTKPWRPDGDLYYYNFIPPFHQNPLFYNSVELWSVRLLAYRSSIRNAATPYRKDSKIFEKYLWLATYFDEICNEGPNCGVEKLAPELRALRRAAE